MTPTEDSDIYFFPIYTEEAQANYHNTIVEPIPTDFVSETTGLEIDSPSVHVWGNKTRVFENRGWTIAPNDVLIFYTQTELLGLAIPSVVQKLENDTALDFCR